MLYGMMVLLGAILCTFGLPGSVAYAYLHPGDFRRHWWMVYIFAVLSVTILGVGWWGCATTL